MRNVVKIVYFVGFTNENFLFAFAKALLLATLRLKIAIGFFKGGRKMLCGVNREEVVQAALTVERWCKEHFSQKKCDCQFADGDKCFLFERSYPSMWRLEEFLRTRGMKKCHSSK